MNTIEAGPDLLRVAILVGGFLLAVAIGPCLVWAPEGWDQRLRFLAFLGYGIVTAGGQLDNLHVAPKWTTYLLAVVTLAALVGTVGHLRRARAALSRGTR